MIPHLLKKLHLSHNHFSEEKKLALKITSISFVVLIGILSTIIGSSYMWQREKIYRDFRDEIRLIEGGHINARIENLLLQATDDPPFYMRENFAQKSGRNKGPRGPRDVLIFSKNKTLLQNDFLDMNESDISELYKISSGDQGILRSDGHTYLIYRKDTGDFTLFLTRDMRQLEEFHEWLMILGGVGSILGIIIIFLLSSSLARMMIEPIREHNRSLDAYSHNVAHELRTPLTVIQSNLELLKLSKSDTLIDSTREEIRGMEQIIESLLMLAHPEKNTNRDEKTNIGEITRNAIESLPEKDNIKYTHPESSIVLSIPSELYRRIVTNLLENAIKYRSGGDIDIILTKGSLEIMNTVEKDIPPEELRKLTGAFYQGDQSRHTSGHGLALVEKICSTLGWRLEIECRGKKFIVKIEFIL